MEWEQAGAGTPQSPRIWFSADSRAVIEEHPHWRKFLVKIDGRFQGGKETLEAAEDLAVQHLNRKALPAAAPAAAPPAPRRYPRSARQLAAFLRDKTFRHLESEWTASDSITVGWSMSYSNNPRRASFDVEADGVMYVVTVRRVLLPEERPEQEKTEPPVVTAVKFSEQAVRENA